MKDNLQETLGDPFRLSGRILITAPKEIPPYLKTELTRLGFPVISETVAGIETEGTLADTMSLNLLLRTGHRVLFRLGDFPCGDADDLYARVSEIEWETYIDPGGHISVHSSVDNPTISNPLFANVRCKDAIVDRFRKVCGRRPDSGSDMSGAVVFLYWRGDECSIYLDTSGEPLAKRGYRKMPMKAPMQETLAASVIMAAGWHGQGNFVNPMCGSGTLAIEAALIGLDRAPGILRGEFGFMHLKGFDREAWNALRAQARKASRKTLGGTIVATDRDPGAIDAARKNAATAGVDHLIEFRVCDFRETPVPAGGGVVVLNPEYGARLGSLERLREVYRGIGDFFKQKCGGYQGYVFTGNLDLAKSIGLRTARRVPFFNGRIECRLLGYEIYEGSRKKP